MKGLRFLAPLLAAAIVLSGCNIIKVNPDRDGAQVVAVVNGENITKKQVYDAAGYTIGQKVEQWDQASFKSNKEQALQSIIQEKVLLLKAKDSGMYNFTDDEKKEISDSITSYYQTSTEYSDALAKYQDQAKTDTSIKPEEKALADAEAELAKKGTTREQLQKQYEDQKAQSKLSSSITDTVTPTDAEVQSYYQSQLTAQQQEFDANASNIIAYDTYGYTIVYYPNDTFFRVRQILIPLPDDVKSKISEYRGKETDADTKAANDLRDSELAKIKPTADKALADAKAAGGDLAKLDQIIKNYGNNDSGMDTFTDGYLFTKDSTEDYMPEWTEAAKALAGVGQPSGLVATDYGYHIIWITKTIAKGAVPFDQLKDKMTEGAKSTKQQNTWNDSVSTWVNTDYKSKIKTSLGKLNN